jgi:hypothetical protein
MNAWKRVFWREAQALRCYVQIVVMIIRDQHNMDSRRILKCAAFAAHIAVDADVDFSKNCVITTSYNKIPILVKVLD